MKLSHAELRTLAALARLPGDALPRDVQDRVDQDGLPHINPGTASHLLPNLAKKGLCSRTVAYRQGAPFAYLPAPQARQALQKAMDLHESLARLAERAIMALDDARAPSMQDTTRRLKP